MPITIGNVRSHVNAVDANQLLTEEALEQIVNRVLARLREQGDREDLSRREWEIRDRMSGPGSF